jgi:hypothetical protein
VEGGRVTVGPGKYDDEATMVMDSTHARAVLVVVLGGDRGEGFAYQATLGVMVAIPAMLRDIADQIEADVPAIRPAQ